MAYLVARAIEFEPQGRGTWQARIDTANFDPNWTFADIKERTDIIMPPISGSVYCQLVVAAGRRIEINPQTGKEIRYETPPRQQMLVVMPDSRFSFLVDPAFTEINGAGAVQYDPHSLWFKQLMPLIQYQPTYTI